MYGKVLNVKIDSGAKCNILSMRTLKTLDIDYVLEPSRWLINGVHGKSMKVKDNGTLYLGPCMYKNTAASR